ncbi:hypothetical protein C3743_39920 [Burkholderia contaminans]|uniref:Uncharacterized protein n=1 Tax=Burkholderia contaminans TaxID=488447 RepID=A0A2S5DMH2_9BURK|nr:hypothetical protein WK28_23755 [Burkholderia vietnamiensis]POZ80277.1 hypothetical protein C3743_39920 [Burkholderia contaminans]
MGVQRFGCVRFDVDDPNVGGWASIDGGEAYRISSVGSLDNRTLWWTNLSFQAMFSSNLHKTGYIKRTTYLNSWLQGGQDEICAAWGLARRTHTEQSITEALSAILWRTMRVLRDRYGIDYERNLPIHDNLADELRCAIMPDKDPHISAEVDAALGAAHQYYTYCITPRVSFDDFVDVRFFVPSVRYSHEMLGGIVPSDQVEFVHDEQLRGIADRVAWTIDQDRPVLARVTVSDVHPDYVNVIAFANGAKSGNNRAWVTQPELLLLSRYANVAIDSAFVFGEYQPLPEACALPKFTSIQALSPSAEIIASNHWIGLSRENPFRLEPNKPALRAHSPRATWITSIDRFVMFTYALQLHRAGIAVRRYGAGAVTTVVPKHNYRDAYEIATAIGLSGPPSIVGDILVQEELQGHG